MFSRAIFLTLCFVFVSIQGCSTTSTYEQAKEDTAVLEEIELLSGRAEAAYQLKQYQKSFDLWAKIIALDPKHTKALYRSGNTQFRLGNVEEARDFYEKTVAISPRHSKAHYNLAVISLVLAEQHFQFYAATTNPKSDLDNVTEILGGISRFKDAQNKTKPTKLERLAEQLNSKL